MDELLIYYAKGQGQQGCKGEESRVCTVIVSTGSEGIKQCEVITIRRNRVGV